MKKEYLGRECASRVGVDGDPGQGERESLDESVATRVDAEILARAFGETANPDDYIPRPECEDVLLGLEQRVFDLGEPATLIAPPGMGKSLLLRVLAQRMADRGRRVELAYGALSFEDLCEWTLRLLGEPVTRMPSDDLDNLLTRHDLLLTIDDASSLPAVTARALGALVRRTPRLRLVLAASEGYLTSRMLAAFGQPMHRLQLAEPMNAEQACAYMTQRLQRWGASDEMLDRLRGNAIKRVVRLSGGVPRRIHEIAHQVLGASPEAQHEGGRDEDWLGAPLDEFDETQD